MESTFNAKIGKDGLVEQKLIKKITAIERQRKDQDPSVGKKDPMKKMITICVKAKHYYLKRLVANKKDLMPTFMNFFKQHDKTDDNDHSEDLHFLTL